MDFQSLIELYKKESEQVTQSLNTNEIAVLVKEVLERSSGSYKIFICGNGGNASAVANFVTDLNLHPYVSEDKSKPIRIDKYDRICAVNLCDSTSTITAIMNDFGPEYIFSEQLKYQANRTDLLICFTGSGSSKNIAMALEYAKELDMISICVTKNKKSLCAELATYVVCIEGHSEFPGQTGKNDNNFHFEDCLSKIAHICTGALRKKIQK